MFDGVKINVLVPTGAIGVLVKSKFPCKCVCVPIGGDVCDCHSKFKVISACRSTLFQF